MERQEFNWKKTFVFWVVVILIIGLVYSAPKIEEKIKDKIKVEKDKDTGKIIVYEKVAEYSTDDLTKEEVKLLKEKNKLDEENKTMVDVYAHCLQECQINPEIYEGNPCEEECRLIQEEYEFSLKLEFDEVNEKLEEMEVIKNAK